jgi:isoleucyl-tRNA synthetase
VDAERLKRLAFDLPVIERQVAARWAHSDLAGRTLVRAAGRPTWSCWTQPSAATGVPGVGYARARTLADLYARFMTMRGMAVPRGHGWDCHGLGVEVAVARELGLSEPRLSEIGLSEVGKSQQGKSELGLSEIEEIERYGAERFVRRCRESAIRHAGAFAAVAERMACMTDQRKIFSTMDRSYIEAVWLSLKQIFEAGLLVRDYRIGRYCPRCRTALAEHEVRGPAVFQKVSGTSAIVRLPIDRLPDGAESQLSGADLLTWTAKPWMLAANTGTAVHPGEPYVVARRAGHGDKVVLADARFARVLGEGWHIVAKFTGADLAGIVYRRPFQLAGTDDDGTGLVEANTQIASHIGTGIAPLAAAYGGGHLPCGPARAIDPIGADGCFGSEIAALAGLFFTNADSAVVADLAERGLLFADPPHRRSQPHCWRCGTPVLTRAAEAWYITTSAIRGGDTADWAVGRTRYWGVPLPIWRCDQGHLTCVGSLAELSDLAGRDLLGVDPHRPAIDNVVIRCRACGGAASRVAETVDAGYDAGAMPFARKGAQLRGSGSVAEGYQADLVVEDAGGSGSWCDAMTVIAAVRNSRVPFHAAIRPGRTLDERGRPMSGRQGNQADPTALIERHGADAVRWHFAAGAPRRADAKVTDDSVGRIARHVLAGYLGSALIFADHADGISQRVRWMDGAGLPAPARPVLDRWLISELHSAVGVVSEALETFRSDVAARRLERFVKDLSGWYLRLSRRRLADVTAPGQAAAALRTLHDCLHVLTRLMAPVAPHLSDYVWDLIAAWDAPSVHLADWPAMLTTLVDERLNEQMRQVRGIVAVGRAARAASMIKAWQPLTMARIACAGGEGFTPELLTLVAEELNVKTVEPVAAVADAAPSPGRLVVSKPAGTVALELAITPALRLEGIARRSILAIKDARRRSGVRVGDGVALGWTTNDDEVGAALTEFGPMISQAVGATDYRRLPTGRAPGARAIEHPSPEVGATFWLTPSRAPALHAAELTRPILRDHVPGRDHGTGAITWGQAPRARPPP